MKGESLVWRIQLTHNMVDSVTIGQKRCDDANNMNLDECSI